MPTKDEKRAELERQYKEHLQSIEDSEEDEAEGGETEDSDDDEIIVMKGNAAKEFIKSLEKMGFSREEAEEEADKIEEEVEEKPKPKKAAAKKAVPPVEDEKPPSGHRFFR